MAAKTAAVTVNIVANAAKAAAGFKQAGDAGAEFAKALSKAADKVEADLKNTADIAERLSKELGENFRTVAGEGVQDLATKINRAGLNMQDLEGNIQDIVGDLRRLEDQAGQTGDRMNDIGTKAGKAGDATKNMAGNAVGDLAAATTGVGILGESVGQLTEGLLEGQVGFKQMLGAGLAMGAVALVMQGLSEKAKRHAEAQRIATDSVDGYREAILRTKTPLEAMTEALDKAGKVILRLPLDMTVDVTQGLVQMGLSASDMARIMSQGQSGIDAWAQKMKAGGIEAKSVDATVLVLTQQLADFDKASEGAAITQAFLAESTSGTHDPFYLQYQDLHKQATQLEQLDALWSDYWNAMDNAALEEEVAQSFLDGNMAMDDRIRLIGQYVQEVLGFPPDAMERFQVALTAGDLTAAERYLETLKRIKEVLGSGNYWYSGDLRRVSGVGEIQTNATGTMAANRGLSIVGERGPELIALGGGERIYNAQQTAGMIGGNTTITVNMPVGTNGDELVRALQDWTRANGALPLATTGTVQR